MRRSFFLAAALLVLGASAAFAYNVLLKNGSIIFAREPYTVKGAKVIITLQNGTVVSYDLDQIDVPGTERYNKENPGNVIAIVPGEHANVVLPTGRPTQSLQEVMRQKKVTIGAPPSKSAAASSSDSASSFQSVEPFIEEAFHRVLDGASISQYRLTTYRGRVRLLATANTEEAVFNTLSATARALADLASKGRAITMEIVLTTSGGEAGGSFEMNPDQARLIVNGSLTPADYFIKNVAL
jgi:archaellum component FlaF (FlaF/FlaG flagellin family)